MKQPKIRVLVAAVLVAGCAPGNQDGIPTATPTRSVVRVGNTAAVEIHTEAGVGQRSFAAPYDRVWKLLPGIFEELGIPVTSRDIRAAETGNPGYRARRVENKRMSSYIDCGTTLSGVLADTHEITLMVITRLAPSADGGTTLTTYVDANGQARATSSNPIHCQSKGTLEARIGELVEERLQGRAPGG